MRNNPIFYIVQRNCDEFKKIYQITQKRNEAKRNYLLIEPKILVDKNVQYIFSSYTYKLIDWHISIYEDILPKCEDEYFHVTFHFAETNTQDMLTLRVYFNQFHNIVHHTIKDEKNTTITASYKNTNANLNYILQMAIKNTVYFYNKLWDFYNKSHNSLEEKYKEFTQRLEEKDLAILTKQSISEKVETFKSYVAELEALVNLFKSNEAYDLTSNVKRIQHFERLKLSAMNHIFRLKSVEVAEKNHTIDTENIHNELVKKESWPTNFNIDEIAEIDKQINLLESSNQSSFLKLINELILLQKKFDIAKDDTTVLNTFIRINNLHKLAYKKLIEYILPGTKTETINDDELDGLISVIPNISFNTFYMAVQNGQLSVVQSLHKHHPHINLNCIHQVTGVTALEHAYQNNNPAMVRLLLKLGAACDTKDKYGNTLLMRACIEQRKQEIEILLEAGASSFVFNNNGYTAFGLISVANPKPNLELIQHYLQYCTDPGLVLSYLQGGPKDRQTPLAFACHHHLTEHVSLYLKYDNELCLTISRMPDYLTPIEICAKNNFADICQMILDCPQSLGLKYFNALELAKKHRSQSVVKLLSEYIARNEIKNEGPVVIGLADVDELANLFMKDQPLSFLFKSICNARDKFAEDEPISNNLARPR